MATRRGSSSLPTFLQREGMNRWLRRSRSGPSQRAGQPGKRPFGRAFWKRLPVVTRGVRRPLGIVSPFLGSTIPRRWQR